MEVDTISQAQCSGVQAQSIAPRLAALSHPARIEILRYLAGCQGRCCKEVVGHLDLAQSTVSQHLKILVEAGLVRVAPEGQRSRFELDRTAISGLSLSVASLLDSCCAGS